MTTDPKTTVVPDREVEQAVRTFRHNLGEAVIRRHEKLIGSTNSGEAAEGRLLSMIVESMGEYGDYDGPPEGQPHPLAAAFQPVSPPVGDGAVEREFRRMREIAQGWRRPNLAQVEGPNDLKIYGGTIADDIDRWADLLSTAAADKAEKERLLGLAMTANGQKNETERLLIAERERSATLQARIAELEGAAGEGRFSGLIDQAWDRLHRPEPDVPGAMVCLNAMKSAALRSTDTGEK